MVTLSWSIPPLGFAPLCQAAPSIPPLCSQAKPSLEHSQEVEDPSRYSAFSVPINCQASSSVPHSDLLTLRHLAPSIPPLGLQTSWGILPHSSRILN